MSEQRLIDANALKERVNRTIDYAIDEFDKGYNIGIQKAVELIDNAPTVVLDNYSMGYQDGVRKVLSEIPKGEWIFTDNRWGLGDWECNKCHKYSNKDTNFCPNCGAEMRKENDNGKP